MATSLLSLYSNNSSGSSNSLYSMYGLGNTLNSVRSGAFRTALKSYYGDSKGSVSSTDSVQSYGDILNGKKASSSDDSSSSKSTASSASSKYTDVKAAADKLEKTAKNLAGNSGVSPFKKASQEAIDEETGEKTQVMDYSRDDIVSAVKNYVSDYNNLIDAINNTGNESLVNKGNIMSKDTNYHAGALSEMGISIGSDAKLTIDEDKLNSADLDKVKELFDGQYSYAYNAYKDANSIATSATIQATKTGQTYSMEWYI